MKTNLSVEIKEKIKILENQLKQLGSYLNAADEKIKAIQEESHEIKYVMKVLLAQKSGLEAELTALKSKDNEK